MRPNEPHAVWYDPLREMMIESTAQKAPPLSRQSRQAGIAAGFVWADETIVARGEEDEVCRKHQSAEAKKRPALDGQIRVPKARRRYLRSSRVRQL
jgi:hypothetical protein